MNPEATIFMWVGINAVLWGYVLYCEIQARRPEREGAGDEHIQHFKAVTKSSFPDTNSFNKHG